MKALAALGGALALVIAAVVARGMLDDDDGSAAGDDVTVVCPPELEDACGSLGGDATVRIEDAAATAEALAGAGDAADVDTNVWLAPAPWAELVADERERAGLPGLVGDPSEVVARSPVTLVVYADRAAALEDGACAGGVTWRCLGEAAERPWSEVGGDVGPDIPGRVEVGLTDPDTSTGLVVLGGATAGYFDTADFATNDFDPAWSQWLSGLGATADDAARGDVVNTLLTAGAAQFAAVGALEVDARQVATAGRDDVRVIYPAPVATADLVAIPIGASSAEDSAAAARDLAADDDLRAALADAGWRVAGEDVADGVDGSVELPDDDGLPSGGVLGALAARWDDARG